MATLADIRSAQEELVRKALDGAVFRAPTSAAHISAATLFDADGDLATLPVEYEDQGLLSSAGISFGREVSTSNTPAFGRTTPVRSDISGDTDTMNIVAIETNRQSIELGTGAVLLPGSRGVNGALEIKKPPRPKSRTYHFLSIAEDESDDGPIYVCRYFPRGKITAYGDQAYTSGDDPIGWPATVTGENDSAWGSPASWIFGGPGWNAKLAAMGFTALAP